MNNFKTIYIAGGGHSGSTLLDLIIGSSEKVFTTGELQFYSEYIEGQANKKCTCGKYFSECEFWMNVNKELSKKIGSYRRLGITNSIKIAYNMINPFGNIVKYGSQEEDISSLLTAIAKEAAKLKLNLKYILDSSKDPKRMYRFSEKLRDNLLIIHIIRDGRAYINSYQKSNRAPQGLEHKNFLQCITEWILINLAIKLYRIKSKSNYISISYDLFCREPLKYITHLNNELKLDLGKDFIKQINNSVYHNIEGNIIRFNEIEAIRYDQKWRGNLSLMKRIISSVILFPFNHMWVSKDSISRL